MRSRCRAQAPKRAVCRSKRAPYIRPALSRPQTASFAALPAETTRPTPCPVITTKVCRGKLRNATGVMRWRKQIGGRQRHVLPAFQHSATHPSAVPSRALEIARAPLPESSRHRSDGLMATSQSRWIVRAHTAAQQPIGWTGQGITPRSGHIVRQESASLPVRSISLTGMEVVD